ncbi:MAG: hypothetical protein D4R64_05880 [Porphyromonadaceae bacterium]|nr:MAG: hypothetical protein D4R64_05880 [Porphyromonadaceae bacterium]
MKYLTISTFILLAALVFVFTKYFLLNRTFKDEQISFISKTIVLKDEIKRLRQNVSSEFNFNYQKVNDFKLSNKNGVSMNFRDLISSSTIILRKTEFGCNDCFGDIISAVKDKDSLDRNKLLIIFSVDNVKDVRYYSQQFGLQDMHIYYAVKTSLPDTLEKSNLSYFFTINKDFIIRDFFIPDINNKNCINGYLSMLKRFETSY